jgi:hypothetical protein
MSTPHQPFESLEINSIAGARPKIPRSVHRKFEIVRQPAFRSTPYKRKHPDRNADDAWKSCAWEHAQISPGRLFINIVRKPTSRQGVISRHDKQHSSRQNTSVDFLDIGRQSLHWAHATNAPVSIGHWSLLRLSARTEALRPSLKK